MTPEKKDSLTTSDWDLLRHIFSLARTEAEMADPDDPDESLTEANLDALWVSLVRATGNYYPE